MRLGAQVYSLRNHGSLSENLTRMAAHGYQWAEPYLPENLSFGQVVDQVERAGLRCQSFHVSPELLADDRFTARCRAQGIKTLVIPFAFFQTEWQWREFASQLEILAQQLQKEGLKLLYHNHSHEFQLQCAGQTVIEFLLEQAPSLGWQMDLGWAFNAGVDVESWLHRYQNRITSLHLKDMDKHGRQPDQLGTAAVPLVRLVSVAAAHGVEDFIIENDQPQDADLMLSSGQKLWQRCVASLGSAGP